MHFIRAASSTIKSRNSSYSESHSSKKASFSLIRPRKFRIGLRNPLLSSRISPADTEVSSHSTYDFIVAWFPTKCLFPSWYCCLIYQYTKCGVCCLWFRLARDSNQMALIINLHHRLLKRDHQCGEHHVTSLPDVVVLLIVTIVNGILVRKGEEGQRLLGTKQVPIRYANLRNSIVFEMLLQ